MGAWGFRESQRLSERPEQQGVCLFAPPCRETALKRSQKLVRIGAGIFRLQPSQEFAAGPPWLGFEPFPQIRRRLDQRVRTTAPPLCFHDRPVCWPDGSGLPRRAQARQEEFDGLLCRGRLSDGLHVRERGEAFLRARMSRNRTTGSRPA